MSPVSYQTIRLSPGKHSSPDDGACVMELASMLAGESFSDHPACVCPVIGSFLRAYNDSVNDERRQDLYEYASLVVDSASTPLIQQARSEHLREWASQMRGRRWSRHLPRPFRWALSHMYYEPLSQSETVGTRAVHAIPRHSDHTHQAVLRLLDELLVIGKSDRRALDAAPARDGSRERASERTTV